MFQPATLRQERPSTYFVQDLSNEEELTRLQIQDREMTRAIGERVLEQLALDPPTMQRVLDVGCGTGAWLIETAKSYPEIPALVGIDINTRVLASAQSQASAQQVAARVAFQAMDALRVLDFPDQSFDLIHQRFGNSYLRSWDWPRLLSEYWRVCQLGGTVLIHEGGLPLDSNSPALTRLFGLMSEAFTQAGHLQLFRSDRQWMIDDLTQQVARAGFQQVQTQITTLDYRSGTFEARFIAANMKSLFRTIVPFLQKWTSVPEDYSEIYQQMLSEVQAPDFAAQGYMLRLWGQKPRG